MDTDEYLNLPKHKNVKEFITEYSVGGMYPTLSIGQRVFNDRVEGKSVREIFEYGYDFTNLPKTFVKTPIYFFTDDYVLEAIDRGVPDADSLERFTVTVDIHRTFSLHGCHNSDKPYLIDQIISKAFQRRFRPEIINGKIDQECLLISQNLVKK